MIDRKFRRPRIWSNEQLKVLCAYFGGSIVNVSGWKDIDKEGKRYKDYFPKATEYWITNYESNARGFQGNLENEVFLDLTKPLEEQLVDRFDVVFNHTVLEHVFDVSTAFANLCTMSKDVVIVVVPFLQEEHADYGDYWRFTPQALDQLFKKNSFETLYVSFNDDKDASIYVVAVGSRHPERWQNIINLSGNRKHTIYDPSVSPGSRVIRNGLLYRLKKLVKGENNGE